MNSKESSESHTLNRRLFLGAIGSMSLFSGVTAFSDGTVDNYKVDLDFDNQEDYSLDFVNLEGLDVDYEESKEDVESDTYFEVKEPGDYRLEVVAEEDGYISRVLEVSAEDEEFDIDLSDLN